MKITYTDRDGTQHSSHTDAVWIDGAKTDGDAHDGQVYIERASDIQITHSERVSVADSSAVLVSSCDEVKTNACNVDDFNSRVVPHRTLLLTGEDANYRTDAASGGTRKP